VEERVAVKSKLHELKGLGVAAEEIGSAEATAQFARLRSLKPILKLVQEFDAGEHVRGEVVRWLLSLPVDLSTTVTVIWPADAVGATLQYRDFAHHFDVLWYPSSDDVWVFAPQTDAWLLELNHEEVFSWWSRGPAN
jgi:hypothetical protein